MSGLQQVSPLVRVDDVTKHFQVGRAMFRRRSSSLVKAVDGVSLEVYRGETLALVGESGCGKTTVGRLSLHLLPPTSGRVLFDGNELSEWSPEALRLMRRRFQIIFQDPFSSLNPRMTVHDLVAEPLIATGEKDRRFVSSRVAKTLDVVGLAASHSGRYPHEFSGGQRQRIGIARALVTRPDFIVCDEAVSALDVSVQGQIVNLLQDLQDTLGVAYLFISHDLGVVKHIASRVAVMYLGRIVELAPTERLFAAPQHPYTRSLLAAVPSIDPAKRRKREMPKGEPPSPLDPPAGCHFHPRCPIAEDICSQVRPALREGEIGAVACHLVDVPH